MSKDDVRPLIEIRDELDSLVSDLDQHFINHPAYETLAEKRRVEIGEGVTDIDRDTIPLAEHLGGEPDRAHLRYSLYFPDEDDIENGFQFATGGNPGGCKLPGFVNTTTGAATGGTPPDGISWSARPATIRPGHPYTDGYAEDAEIKFLSQAYHLDMSGEYGDELYWDIGCDRGEWVTIDQYIQMNHPNKADGVMRAWVNGEQALDETGLRWRDTPQSLVNRVWYGFYFGGQWESPQDQYIEIRDLGLWAEELSID